MPRPPHILFAGGGAPGHLYPGLAVAAHVVKRIPEVMATFVGGGRTVERHIVRAAGFRHVNLPSQPAPQNALHAVRFVTDNVAGYWASRWYLKEQRVSLVVGLGGAASAPAVRAAMSRGIPTVMLEQNVVPGRVTRWLAPSATMVCAGFESTRSYFPSSVPLVVTGNPARPAFEQLYRQKRNRGDATAVHDSHHEKRLIIIGGAGGARSINQNIPAALARLRDQLCGWRIVHQSGEGQLQDTERRYREAGVEALVVAFIDEMAPVMFDADLVVCRAGGTTLAELALAGLPAVLVPYPPVMDYHLPNAEAFSSAGAATIIDETDLAGSLEDALVENLSPMLVDDTLRAKMATSMRRLACPDAAARVTDSIHNALYRNTVRLAA